MVQGNIAFSGQSGVHWPVTGSRESPPSLTLPNSTILVRTGATTGICSVSTSGTWLLSLGPQLLATVKVTPGASTLGTELTTLYSNITPTTGSSGLPASAWPNGNSSLPPRPSSRITSSFTR